MSQDNKIKLIKMVLILLGLALAVWLITAIFKESGKSLADYAAENPQLQNQATESAESEDDTATDEKQAKKDNNDNKDNKEYKENKAEKNDSDSENTSADDPCMVGYKLNASIAKQFRITYAEGFYYEPLSDELREYITGTSYPALEEGSKKLEITYDELCYMHVLHYDFNGEVAEGELICNLKIADDLVEIFEELYENEYQIEKIHLIDLYDGDDTSSMEDNNTSCFNYRLVENSKNLSKHAYGLAIDVNPLYNPYITYNKDGSENCSPEGGIDYKDRSKNFPYKIDESDLCYKLFKQHGFTWGGNWNSVKDYQHFQKTK